MQLPVVPAHLAHNPALADGLGCEPPTDHPRVVRMALPCSVLDAVAFRYVSIRPCDIRIRLPQLVDEALLHRVRRSCVAQRMPSHSSQHNLPTMQRLVACLAQRDEVVRRVASRLTGLDVVDVEHLVLAPAVAVLARVPVPRKDVLADVPEAHLLALLVLGTFNAWIVYPLRVEVAHLNMRLRHW